MRPGPKGGPPAWQRGVCPAPHYLPQAPPARPLFQYIDDMKDYANVNVGNMHAAPPHLCPRCAPCPLVSPHEVVHQLRAIAAGLRRRAATDKRGAKEGGEGSRKAGRVGGSVVARCSRQAGS